MDGGPGSLGLDSGSGSGSSKTLVRELDEGFPCLADD